MENLENSKVLKEIGLDERNKWILNEEKSRKFFEFVANNLDDENILTNSELAEYEKLVESGKVLSDEELENELKNIEQTFPGFFSASDDVLDELEEEVKKLEADISERSERLSRMKDFEEEQLKTLSELDRINNEIGLKGRLLSEECLKRSSELENLQETNAQEIAQLNRIYTQQQSSPSIMSQMPLDSYFTKCNQLLGLLQLYMNQNFNIIKGTDNISNADEESQINDIYQIKTEIIQMHKKKFEEEMNVAGMNYLSENIEKYQNRISGDFYDMKSLIDNLIMEKENLETHLNVLMLEGKLLVENIAEQKIVKVFHEFYVGKNKRAKDRAEKITQVHELTDNIAYVCELMWVALQLDLNRLKNRVDNSEEMNNQSQDCMKRIRQMKQISAVDHSNSYSHQFLNLFQKLLIENIHSKKEDLSSIEKCFKEYVNYDEQVNAVMQMLIEQKQFSKIQKTIKILDDQSNILRDLIFCGPTNKPRLYDPKFIVPLHEKQSKKKEFEKIFQELKFNFQTNIIQPYSNDKFYRMKELLYIWFCSEPKKVLLAIKEVQKQAAEEGSASYKALNITVSH